METMRGIVWSSFVAGVSLGTAVSAGGQTPVGALAIDERQGDQYGWAVDYETTAAAQARASRECGAGCSVVLTFDRCAAYAADQDVNSTAVGWAESHDSAASARRAALSECSSRGGSGCTVRVWGCNGPVAEEGLGLDRAARRQIQLGLRTTGFDPGGADGLFGPRTRAAIRRWQAAGNVPPTGYLTAMQLRTLRDGGSSPGSPPVAGSHQVAPESPAVAEVSEPEVPEPDPEPASLVFRPDQTCGDLPAQGNWFGAPCWMELSQQPGCYAWNATKYRQRSASVTWTGQCVAGTAQGTGTLTWAWLDSTSGRARTATQTGQLADGRQTGNWVDRADDGGVEEGPYVDGMRHGHWIFRSDRDRGMGQGSYVNGEQHGRWSGQRADGTPSESYYEHGRFIRRGR